MNAIFRFLYIIQMVLMGPTQSNFEPYLQGIENKFKVAQISTDSLDISKMIILDARKGEEFFEQF
jgi:hypothetical protein